MQSIRCLVLVIFLVFFSKALFPQDSLKDLDQVYGLDQTLCNGKKYTYIQPPGSTGHPFLVSPAYFVGSVSLGPKCYRDVILNYDIFNQQLLLQYADAKGVLYVIEVSKAWLKGFSLGSKNFELLSEGREPGYFQVMGKGSLRILYFWRKTLKTNDVIGSSNFVFSAAIRDSYVLMDGKLKPYRTKRSLIRVFNPEQRPAIKSYMRKNKVKIRKSSDEVMEEMITFIGNLR